MNEKFEKSTPIKEDLDRYQKIYNDGRKYFLSKNDLKKAYGMDELYLELPSSIREKLTKIQVDTKKHDEDAKVVGNRLYSSWSRVLLPCKITSPVKVEVNLYFTSTFIFEVLKKMFSQVLYSIYGLFSIFHLYKISSKSFVYFFSVTLLGVYSINFAVISKITSGFSLVFIKGLCSI